MWGMTPPPAMVALISVSSSSSPRIASCKWRGVIRFTLRSLHALPANSSTSAVKYSRIAAVYTADVAPTRWWECTRDLRNLCIRPTGNCKPALDDRDCGAFFDVGALPPLPPFPPLPPLPDCRGTQAGREEGTGKSQTRYAASVYDGSERRVVVTLGIWRLAVRAGIRQTLDDVEKGHTLSCLKQHTNQTWGRSSWM